MICIDERPNWGPAWLDNRPHWSYCEWSTELSRTTWESRFFAHFKWMYPWRMMKSGTQYILPITTQHTSKIQNTYYNIFSSGTPWRYTVHPQLVGRPHPLLNIFFGTLSKFWLMNLTTTWPWTEVFLLYIICHYCHYMCKRVISVAFTWKLLKKVIRNDVILWYITLCDYVVYGCE